MLAETNSIPRAWVDEVLDVCFDAADGVLSVTYCERSGCTGTRHRQSAGRAHLADPVPGHVGNAQHTAPHEPAQRLTFTGSIRAAPAAKRRGPR